MAPPLTLTGDLVRLEPLSLRHVQALATAASEDRATYRWNVVPADEPRMTAYVTSALTGRRDGHMLPFTVVRQADRRIVGSTRFCRIARWTWPPNHPQRGRNAPDVCEIGYTWLAHSAQRTGINVEAKLLLLGHAFEHWQVHRVSFRTDIRNQRSRAAIQQLHARFEGIHRADRPAVDGTVRDSAIYSILRDEWPDVKARLERRLKEAAER